MMEVVQGLRPMDFLKLNRKIGFDFKTGVEFLFRSLLLVMAGF